MAREATRRMPGLQELLLQTPKKDRHGWVVNPLPIAYHIRSTAAWFKPTSKDLKELTGEFNNCAIARACAVTETTVRKWLVDSGIVRKAEYHRHLGDIEQTVIADVRRRAERQLSHPARRSGRRLTKETGQPCCQPDW